MARFSTNSKKMEQRFFEEKNSVAMAVLSSEDQNLIQMMKSILAEYEKITKKKVNVKQYNNEIAQAEKRIKKGHFTLHEDVLKEMKEW